LIANIVAVQHMTVGIVSFGNAAVDNVRDNVERKGFGHVIGNLGRREKRQEFFATQAARNAQVGRFVVRAPDRPEGNDCPVTELWVSRYRRVKHQGGREPWHR
jgi:hypothetical protein